MFFLSSFLSFLYSIALLCSVKKSLNRTKIAIFRFNQKSQDKFIIFSLSTQTDRWTIYFVVWSMLLLIVKHMNPDLQFQEADNNPLYMQTLPSDLPPLLFRLRKFLSVFRFVQP